MSTIGERVKKIREVVRMTQAGFAQSLGYVQGHISGIERGVCEPSKRFVDTIQWKFCISKEWLACGEGTMFVGARRAVPNKKKEKNMLIYIASSWKNQHAVEMLTELLRKLNGVDVISFVEKAIEDEGREGLHFDADEWIDSDAGREKFFFNLEAATCADLVIYLAPSGTDAWAEVGAAWGRGVPVWGLRAKGDPAGLNRHMMDRWFLSYEHLLAEVDKTTAETERIGRWHET